MKKQFYRALQLADQTFNKTEKSEVLNHKELQNADEKVEYFRVAISAITKRLSVGNVINDKDKRLKKTVEYQYYQTFSEECRQEELCELFQCILKEASQVEKDLAAEYAEHEMKVEELVYSPFQKVLENEFPNILKHKRNIAKYCLDRDSASNRYNTTKKETLKDDMDEAHIKVEHSRDALAIEMFTLLAKEHEFSTYILQLLKLQRGYHESALKSLERVIPDLEKKIGDSSVKRVFGTALKEHLRVTGERLAFPLQICVAMLSKYGMSEEGLFRIAGSVLKVKRLKASIDAGCFSSSYMDIPEYCDVHILASTLKLYLRELPEPLLTYELYTQWMQCMHSHETQRVDIIKDILSKLPKENRENLGYLIHFLAKLTLHHENKMSASNIAIVIAPNLLWNKNEDSNMNMGNCATVSMLIELLIKEAKTLFPEDPSKYVTFKAFDCDVWRDSGTKTENATFVDYIVSMDSISNQIADPSNSPKPNSRKKKPVAPVPPIGKIDQDSENVKLIIGSHYPSGSVTLNRPHKSSKETTNASVNTDEYSSKIGSFVKDEKCVHNKVYDRPKISALVSPHDTSNSIDDKYAIKLPTNVNNLKGASETVESAQTMHTGKNFRTTVTHQIHTPSALGYPKPVAAPRSLLSENDKPHEILEPDVLLRRSEVERILKPEIPARPLSLQKRTSAEGDPAVQKTQCSVYSVANKQQPSIVNIQNRNEKFQLGHDNQIAEKEKFLGHLADQNNLLQTMSLENRYNSDVNFNNTNTNNPRKSITIPKENNFYEHVGISRSNEKLNDQKFNGNTKHSHSRTRSDGNLVELSNNLPSPLLQTPPSPRSLNKPTQPPPPPPIISKKKMNYDSTDL